MTPTILDRISNRLVRFQEEQRRRNIPQPSFYTKMAERKRLAAKVRRLRGISDGPIYDIETKVGQKTVAEKAGVRTADILQGPFDTLAEFDLDSLPERFVIKPNIGSGANGVFLLEKKNSQLLNVLSGDIYPNNLTELNTLGISKFKGISLIAEELIELKNRPTLDWKVFSFFGEVAFIRQGDQGRSGKPYKLWSPDGRDLGPIDGLGFPYDSNLPPPHDLKELIDTAKKISLNLVTPFVRVDLYESNGGVFLGEVTLRPSSLWKKRHLLKLAPEWDRKLGEMWEDAQARIIEKVGEGYLP